MSHDAAVPDPEARVTCHELRGRLDDFLDGELSAGDTARLVRHLAGCPECRALVDHERAVLEGIRHALQSGDVPHWLEARISAAVAFTANTARYDESDRRR
jgi:anti-sigma factor (TIGR02949 family)